MDQQIELLPDEIADLPGKSGLLEFPAKTLGRLRWEDSVALPFINEDWKKGLNTIAGDGSEHASNKWEGKGE